MSQNRREFLKQGSRLALLGGLIASGLAGVSRAMAAEWNRAAFTAKTLTDALANSGYKGATHSNDIVLKVPDIAENGAVVPVEVTSNIPGTTSIAIFSQDNPNPLVAEFTFLPGAVPFVSTRIKMAKTSQVQVAVKAGGKVFMNAKSVKVTAGGCGG